MTQRVIRLVLTGGLTGVKPPARPNATELVGIVAPATIWVAEATGEEPGLVRVIWSKQ